MTIIWMIALKPDWPCKTGIYKAIRAGRANIGEAYAVVRGAEMFLFGAQITPLISASTHVIADDRSTRKLLLHRHEIDRLVGRVERDGYTLIPTASSFDHMIPLHGER